MTVRGRGYLFPAIIVTIRTLTLVAADFHPQNYLFATDQKADSECENHSSPNGHDRIGDRISELVYFRYVR